MSDWLNSVVKQAELSVFEHMNRQPEEQSERKAEAMRASDIVHIRSSDFTADSVVHSSLCFI